MGESPVMLTLAILALLGYSAFNSDTDNVAAWAKESSKSFFEASETVVVKSEEGCYLNQGPKEILWAAAEERPGAFIRPEAALSQKEIIQKVQQKLSSTPEKAPKQFGGTDDLGLLEKKDSNLGVNTDEILSYFEKKPISKFRANESNNVTTPTDLKDIRSQRAP